MVMATAEIRSVKKRNPSEEEEAEKEEGVAKHFLAFRRRWKKDGIAAPESPHLITAHQTKRERAREES